MEETKKQWQISIKEWRQNHEEERRKTQVDMQDSIMTSSREDTFLEKVKHSKSFHNRKRNSVNHSKDNNFEKVHNNTADTTSYSNHSSSSSPLRSCKTKKVAISNGHSISLNHRHNLRTRTNSSCKTSADESSNHSPYKGHNNGPLPTSPHRSSSRITSKAVESPSKQVNSHSSRSNRHSSRLQNVDLNSSANSNHSFSTRRSSRNVSFR